MPWPHQPPWSALPGPHPRCLSRKRLVLRGREADPPGDRARAGPAVPPLVLDYIPCRDCAQYSSGGANSLKEYEKWIDGVPTLLVQDGRPLKDRMDKARVDEEDILASARELQGLERMEQIKYAVLERGGHISIIPKPAATR